MVRIALSLLACLLAPSVGCGLGAAEPISDPPEARFTFEHPKPPPHTARFAVTQILENPVLMRGTAAADWDHVDLLNPSVLRDDQGFVAYYSGFNGKIWQTGVATSPDGVAWTKYSGNPVLSPGVTRYARRDIAANGDAAIVDGRLRLFFQGHDESELSSISEGTSLDGRTFPMIAAHPVLEVGPKGSWDDSAVGDPNVIAAGGYYYLYYLGMNAVGTQRIGVARSIDGVTWQKYAGNPILDAGATGDFDENGVGEPAVVFVAPYFYLIYTGRDAREKRHLGVAVARDPVNWRKVSRAPLVAPDARRDWNRQVMCDPSIVSAARGDLLVYFGGGDAADPAQDIHGNVGLLRAHAGVQVAAFDTAAEPDGIAGPDFLIGSFPSESSPGGSFVWVGPEAEVTLTAVAPKNLHLVGWIPMNLYHQRGIADRVTLAVTAGGRKLGAVTADSTQDGLFDVTFPLTVAPSGDGSCTITLQSDQSLPPAGSDRRTLSYIVRKIELQ